MAILIHSATGQRVVLLPQHIFGRYPSASTVLDDADASRLHASVRWTGERWELRDHSRNGTLLDGQRVVQDVATVLGAGQSLMFGSNGSAGWKIHDVGAPAPLLMPDDGREPIALSSSNLFPGPLTATVAIARDGNGHWECTTEESAWSLHDGDELTFGGCRWTFFSGDGPRITEETPSPAVTVPAWSVHFSVSLDEEHVVLRIGHGDGLFEMGERTHHYLLLTLARIRIDDAERGLGSSEQGWVAHDRLSRMLGLDSSHLNIQIFRLRSQLAQALGKDQEPPALIERRRGESRLGDVAVHIRRGTQPSVSFIPDRPGPAR